MPRSVSLARIYKTPSIFLSSLFCSSLSPPISLSLYLSHSPCPVAAATHQSPPHGPRAAAHAGRRRAQATAFRVEARLGGRGPGVRREWVWTGVASASAPPAAAGSTATGCRGPPRRCGPCWRGGTSVRKGKGRSAAKLDPAAAKLDWRWRSSIRWRWSSIWCPRPWLRPAAPS